MIEGVEVTDLERFADERGEVRRVLRNSDACFRGFGEAYLSSVNRGMVKGWKKHTQMHSNLVIISGRIRWVLFDDRPTSSTCGQFGEIIGTLSNYSRLTIPPGIWVAFQGLSDELNLLLNVASLVHDPTESINVDLDSNLIPAFDWQEPLL